MILCQIMSVYNTKGLNSTICNGSRSDRKLDNIMSGAEAKLHF